MNEMAGTRPDSIRIGTGKPDKNFQKNFSEKIGLYDHDLKRAALKAYLLSGGEVSVRQEPPQDQKPIRIPEGKMGAHGDHRIVNYTLGETSIPLIHQTSHDLQNPDVLGNCAEYSSINAARILWELGFPINPIVGEHFSRYPRTMNVNTIEEDLVVPLLRSAHERLLSHINFSQNPDRKAEVIHNLRNKSVNPYAALDAENCIMLLTEMLTPHGDMDPLVTSPHEVRERSGTEVLLINEHNVHQTIQIHLNETTLCIDTLRNPAISIMKTHDAVQRLQQGLGNGSIHWYHPVRMK
jgi:hypothetical protein